MVAAQIELIHAVQSDEWWQDVTVATLESVRRHLRALVAFIEKNKRKLRSYIRDGVGFHDSCVTCLGL